MTPSLSFLVDSSADDSFFDQDLVTQASILTEVLSKPKTILNLNREILAKISNQTTPLTLVSGNHREQILFFLIPASSSPGVLGVPWLAHQNPQFDWSASRLNSLSVSCRTNGLRSALSYSSGT